MIEEADRDGDGASWTNKPGRRGAALARCPKHDRTTADTLPLALLFFFLFARAGYVVFDDFFRIMKKKSDNPLDDLDDDDDV